MNYYKDRCPSITKLIWNLLSGNETRTEETPDVHRQPSPEPTAKTLSDHIHELRIKEEPQFIEVTQPPMSRRNVGQIESDGRILDSVGDPPGQQSYYIRPGDPNSEAYRLSTFENFPNSSPVSVALLARSGFLYTGYFDRVRCFSCGRNVEKWEIGNNPADKMWHRPSCLLAQGQPSGNIPINSLLGNQSLRTPQTQSMEVSRDQQNSTPADQAMGNSADVADRWSGPYGTFTVAPGDTLNIGSGRPPVVIQYVRDGISRGSGLGNSPSSNQNPPRQWRMANVISAEHRRFLINLYLNREIDRLASFARWPTGRPNVSPAALAKTGFFYLGDMDRTQCFSCGGVLRNWAFEDDASEEHRTHFPNCPFVLQTEHRNVPVPTERETQQDLARIYPCRYPSNPHMRSEVARIETFDSRWPRGRTRASPAEIAEAGFFFLGERDRVKCWYCNGGLQHWEYDDVPWIEHAKWFPNCQFLLQKQGQTFVNRHLAPNAHLPRPIIGRQDGATVDPTERTGEATRGLTPPPSGSRARAPSPPPIIIDPQEEMRKRKERVEKEIRDNDTVKTVIAMGFKQETVRRVLQDRLESGDPFDDENIFEGVTSLLEAVMEKDKEAENEENEQAMEIRFPSISSIYSSMSMSSLETNPSWASLSGTYMVSDFDESDDEVGDLYGSYNEAATAASSSARSTPTLTTPKQLTWNMPNDPKSIKEIIEQKIEERSCKVCFTETADMVFVPCSHMVCCRTCTESIRQCPVCRVKIEKAIRAYVK